VILRARIVLPICGPPIENGAVEIDADRIVAVGKWSEFRRGRATDLGEVVLMPGLVNAHCHLDYTDLRIVRGGKSFTQWVQTIIKKKLDWTVAEYRKSWVRGARMLEETGTTTVADIEAVPDLIPWAWKQTFLRVFSFVEMTGVASGRAPKEIVSEALKFDSFGLSPHALYSTVPQLLKLTAWRARTMPITMHVAESEDEMRMYSRRKGELFEWLSRVRDMSDCGGTTPVQAVQRAGLLGPKFLAVHVNFLTREDVLTLALTKTSVVHCPSSHAYFGHRRFPFQQLDRAGVNVSLGTDSMASMRGRELNMFLEMRQFARAYPSVSPVQILQMATLNGARALQLPVGELRKGALADLISVPFRGKTSQVESAILDTRNVNVVWVSGRKR
jgi:aminodeoxyfutalosine deaminase